MKKKLSLYLTHSPEAFELYFGSSALSRLQALSHVIRNSRQTEPSEAEIIHDAQGCDVIVSYRQPGFSAKLLQGLPQVAAICRVAVDVRNIDIEAANESGILVTHATPGFGPAVAELILGFMIDLGRQISQYNAIYHTGEKPVARLGTQLRGSSVGIVGYGTIGRYLRSVATALGMKTLICDPHIGQEQHDQDFCDFQTLLAQADYVVCLATASAATTGLFDAEAFNTMKPSAFFINASRGELVDEAALLSAIDQNQIAGAALDVGSGEDQMPAHQLAIHPRVIATPHMAGLTFEATLHQAMDVVRQVEQIVDGKVPEGSLNARHASRLQKLQQQLSGN